MSLFSNKRTCLCFLFSCPSKKYLTMSSTESLKHALFSICRLSLKNIQNDIDGRRVQIFQLTKTDVVIYGYCLPFSCDQFMWLVTKGFLTFRKCVIYRVIDIRNKLKSVTAMKNYLDHCCEGVLVVTTSHVLV